MIKPPGSPNNEVLDYPLPTARGFEASASSKSTASFCLRWGEAASRRSVPKLNITSPYFPSRLHETLPWVFGPYLEVKSCPSQGAAELLVLSLCFSSSLAPAVEAATSESERMLELLKFLVLGSSCVHCYRSPLY